MVSTPPIRKTFLAAYRALLVESFCLIAFGGLVRAMDSGLACPDWPLCFGHFVPEFHPQVYFEFIHRAFAGTITLLVLTLHFLIWRNPAIPRALKQMALISVLLLSAQVVLGGLTVLDLLKAGIVTLHLGFGCAFFVSMLWIYFHLRDLAKASGAHLTANVGAKSPAPRPGPHSEDSGTVFPLWPCFVALVIFAQILLGGWVASNYAGLACGNDFPLCYGHWVPTFTGTIGVQVIHRLGAYVTASVILIDFLFIQWTARRCKEQDPRVRTWSYYLLSLVPVQIVLGVANVKFGLPPLLANLHLCVAVTMLATSMRLVYLRFICGDRLEGRQD